MGPVSSKSRRYPLCVWGGQLAALQPWRYVPDSSQQKLNEHGLGVTQAQNRWHNHHGLLYHFDQVFSHGSQMTLNWTLQVFRHGSRTAMNTCLCRFLGNFGPFWPILLTNERFWCLSRPKFGSWTLPVFTSVTPHTLWTVGWNGTVCQTKGHYAICWVGGWGIWIWFSFVLVHF